MYSYEFVIYDLTLCPLKDVVQCLNVGKSERGYRRRFQTQHRTVSKSHFFMPFPPSHSLRCMSLLLPLLVMGLNGNP